MKQSSVSQLHKRRKKGSMQNYLCPYCSFNGKKLNFILLHVKHVHNNQYIYCHLCLYKTFYKFKLKRHFIVHHAKENK